MRFSTFLKGALIVATLLLVGTEAYAQLPVRTQQLQLINPAGGTLTHDLTTGAASTSWSLTWPQDAFAPTDSAILLGISTVANQVDLQWLPIDGFVDGSGADNHVAWWNPDANTLDHSENFEWDGTTLGVGMNTYNSAEATAAGNIQIGDGTNAQIQLNVAAGTGTFGNATTAGTVNLTNATGTNNVQLAGATGTATLGSATDDGQLVLNDGGGFTVTVDPGTQVANQTIVYDAPTLLAGAGPFYLTPSTNQAGAATDTYLYQSNGDGTASWVPNPLGNFKAGEVTPTANAYTAAVVFNTVFPAVPIVSVTVNGVQANIVQVTNITVNGFTINSTAPFDGTDEVHWMANSPNNP